MEEMENIKEMQDAAPPKPPLVLARVLCLTATSATPRRKQSGRSIVMGEKPGPIARLGACLGFGDDPLGH